MDKLRRKRSKVLAIVVLLSAIIQPTTAFAKSQEANIDIPEIEYTENSTSDEELKTMNLVEQKVLVPTMRGTNEYTAISKTYKKDELVVSEKKMTDYNTETTEQRVATICEVVKIIPSSKEGDTQLVAPRADTGDSGFDTTYSYKFTLRIYYTKASFGVGGSSAKVTKVTGSNEKRDNSVRLDSQKVRAGAAGFAVGGGLTEQRKDFYPTGSSFSYSSPTNFNFPKAIILNGEHTVGANYFYTLRRGTKSAWSGTFQCNI